MINGMVKDWHEVDFYQLFIDYGIVPPDRYHQDRERRYTYNIYYHVKLTERSRPFPTL